MMPTFRCQGQDWELPNITQEPLANVRPSLFISYFFAIDSNKREPASSNNKHFLTEAFRALLEYKLGYRQGGDDMTRALQRWKDDKYWTVGHGGPGDSFSTRNNPNAQMEGQMVSTSQDMDIITRPDKEYECFFWRRNGFCKFSDDDCVYAHYPTGKVKEYIDAKDKANYLKAYKNTNNTAPKQECFYWTQGTCRFSDDKCLFAHYHVNRISDYPELRDRGRDQEPPNSFYPDKAMITYPAKLADKQLECYYWRNTSFCKYTEDECLYAHHPTGRVKELPGMPRSIDTYRDSPETRSGPEIKKPDPDIKKLEKNSPKAIKGLTSYIMPDKSAMKLSELTLSAFYDLFCYTNPTARKDRPWEALLISYKDHITKHFGRDTLKHIIAAYTRTKLPIPSDLLKSHVAQLEADLASKALLGPLESEVSNTKTPVDSSKRLRSIENEIVGMIPKRMKSEREVIAVLPEPDIVTEFLRQIPRKDDQSSTPANEVHREVRNGIVQSPSSSRGLSEVGPAKNGDQEHGTLKRTQNDVPPTSRIGAHKTIVNGNHSPSSSLTRINQSNMPAPSEPRASMSQASQAPHIGLEDKSNKAAYILNGDSQVGGSLNASDTGMVPKPAPKAYGYREEIDEPLSAHIVRLDALLRGALMELDSLKRIAR